MPMFGELIVFEIVVAVREWSGFVLIILLKYNLERAESSLLE